MSPLNFGSSRSGAATRALPPPLLAGCLRLCAPSSPAGGASLLAGVTKLYASHSGLQSLEALQGLTAIRYLYLDHNALTAEELLRLPGDLPWSLWLLTRHLCDC